MKKTTILTFALAAAIPFAGGWAVSNPALAAAPAVQQQSGARISVQSLKTGTVTIYDYGTIKLYAYATNDPLSDECYALESKDGVVLLESTILHNNIQEWSQFVSQLQRPVVAELMAYHPNGYAAYGKHPVYATEQAVKNWQPGGGIYAIVGNLDKAFGSATDLSMPDRAELLKEGQTIQLAGITFNILPAGDDAYSVEIPQIHAVYRHMMGSDVHNILISREQIAAEIQTMQGYQQKQYDLILTGHYKPEGQAAVAQKIGYLKKVQELAGTSPDRASFIQSVKEAFPNYQGDNYLDMTASFLFTH